MLNVPPAYFHPMGFGYRTRLAPMDTSLRVDLTISALDAPKCRMSRRMKETLMYFYQKDI